MGTRENGGFTVNTHPPSGNFLGTFSSSLADYFVHLFTPSQCPQTWHVDRTRVCSLGGRRCTLQHQPRLSIQF